MRVVSGLVSGLVVHGVNVMTRQVSCTGKPSDFDVDISTVASPLNDPERMRAVKAQYHARRHAENASSDPPSPAFPYSRKGRNRSRTKSTPDYLGPFLTYCSPSSSSTSNLSLPGTSPNPSSSSLILSNPPFPPAPSEEAGEACGSSHPLANKLG